MKKRESAKPTRSRQLVAGARLSNYRIKRVIERYCEGDTVRAAAEATGISHVTVGNIFQLIRQRLLDVGIYQSLGQWNDDEDAVEEESDGHFWSHAGAHDKIVNRLVSARRGVRAENRPLYEAEALFRQLSPDVSAAELLRVILNVIKRTGPLGADPIMTVRAALFVSDEYRRRLFNRYRSEMRAVLVESHRNALEPDVDDHFRQLNQALEMLGQAEEELADDAAIMREYDRDLHRSTKH